MEKKAQKKTYKDPALNKIIQEKAAWNKQVSALINDLIHFKKSMNGWPSKYYKERTRITQPTPIDLPSILNQIAGDFQEITNRGNGILQEQSEFSKSHLKRHTDRTLDRLEKMQGPTEAAPPAPPTPGGPVDLSQQLGKGLAFIEDSNLIKLASELEGKYFLESQASNPITRFITRLFNPKFGFGEAARMRRLRMTMLDSCAKTYKSLKTLQAVVVKSSDSSIEQSHKMMTMAWNNWNIVYRLATTFKGLKPGGAKDPGGIIEDPDLKKQREIEEGYDPEMEQPTVSSVGTAEVAARMIKDYRENVLSFGNDPEIVRRLQELNSIVERILAAPKNKKIFEIQNSGVEVAYQKAIELVNAEWGTSGSTFQEIAAQRAAQVSARKKDAQEFRGFLGKTRHQLLPGGTSGSRLEIYNTIGEVKKEVNLLMDLLEKGYEQDKIEKQVTQIHRQMSVLRTMIRSLFYSVKPDKAPAPFF